jgi:hypothetical protein
MSMMMPPDPNAGMPPPGGGPPPMPMPPGGGGAAPGEMAPMDALSGQGLPAEGGIEGLIAALQAGGGGAPPGAEGLPSEPEGPGGPGGLGLPIGGDEEGPDMADMSPVEHIQHAMKHLMMAMAADDDDERGAGVMKGMGALQSILGGEQKKQKLLASAGG